MLFAYLENLTSNLNSGSAAAKAEYDRILKVIQRSKEDLVNVGYSEFAVEDFHEVSSVTRFLIVYCCVAALFTIGTVVGEGLGSSVVTCFVTL